MTQTITTNTTTRWYVNGVKVNRHNKKHLIWFAGEVK